MLRDGEGLAAPESQLSSKSLALGTKVAMSTHTDMAASCWHEELHSLHCWEELGRKGPEPGLDRAEIQPLPKWGISKP